MDKTKQEIRPLYHKLTPYNAATCRSPMVSLIFPSTKDKIRMHADSSMRQRQVRTASAAAGSRQVAKRELDNIVKTESRKRNPNNYFNLN